LFSFYFRFSPWTGLRYCKCGLYYKLQLRCTFC